MYLEMTGRAFRAERFCPGIGTVRVGKLDVAAGNRTAFPVDCQSSNACSRAGAGPGCMEMAFMALQAEERLALLEKVVGDRAVGVVADIAVLLNRAVLENKRTLIPCVAVVAEVIDTLIRLETLQGGTMCLVAAGAGHLPLSYRMV